MIDLGAAWLNVCSIALGLAAWALPFVGYGISKRKERGLVFCCVSIMCSAVAVCLQLHYQAHLVRIGDGSALLDTADAVAWISLFLVGSTAVVNGFVIWRTAANAKSGLQ